jgi:hypothetical protein
MKYIALIYGNEAGGASMTQEQIAVEYQAYDAFGKSAASAIVGAEQLRPTSDATTVRVRDGKTLTTDGPFAETKEQLGGYYVFDCKNLDEAIALAAKIPGAQRGSVEVRPLVVFS